MGLDLDGASHLLSDWDLEEHNPRFKEYSRLLEINVPRETVVLTFTQSGISTSKVM